MHGRCGGLLVLILLCCAIAVPLVLAAPTLSYDADYEDNGPQWHVQTKMHNTPVLRFTLYQGTNTWDPPAGWTFYFKAAANNSATNTPISITGTETAGVVEFQADTNSFTTKVENWYAVVEALSNGLIYSYSEGQLSVDYAPEW